jgi:hypothetical protein
MMLEKNQEREDGVVLLTKRASHIDQSDYELFKAEPGAKPVTPDDEGIEDAFEFEGVVFYRDESGYFIVEEE